MTNQSLLRITFFALMIIAGGLCPAPAHEEQGNPAPNANKWNGPESVLTPDEKQQMIKARQQAVTNDPSLKTEMDDLQKQRESLQAKGNPDENAKRQLMQAYKAHEEKMRAAMLKADPTIEPLFAKIDKKKQEMMQKCQPGGGATQ